MLRTIACLVGAAILSSAPASAQPAAHLVEVAKLRQKRELGTLAAGRDYRLAVDLPLYRASLSVELLADLRIAGPDGRLIPHLVRELGGAPIPPIPGRIFDPGTVPEAGTTGSARATFELPEGPPRCRVQLQLNAAGDYLCKTRVETGARLDDLQRVAEGAPVYAITNAAGGTSQGTAVAFPESQARYVRVTIFGCGEALPPAIQAGNFSCGGPGRGEAPRGSFDLNLVASAPDPNNKRTRIDLDAGAEGAPIERLVFTVATPEFLRRVQLSASSQRQVWPPAGAAVIYRVAGAQRATIANATAGLAENTAVPAGGVRKRWLRAEIEDGDDAPLDVRAVRAEYAEREIVFRTNAAGRHTLYVGDPAAQPPSFDLVAIMARRVSGAETTTVAAQGLEANPEFGKSGGGPEQPFSERHRGVIGAVLGVLLVALAGWSLRIARKTGRPAP